MSQNWKKKIIKNACFLTVFRILFNLGSNASNYCSFWSLGSFNTPGMPEGALIVNISLFWYLFLIFLQQRHLVKFFILFKLKAVVTFIDATCIKRWRYHFSEPQWRNFLNFKFIPLPFWCLQQQCSVVHFWKSELYLGWFWFLIQTLTNTKSSRWRLNFTWIFISYLKILESPRNLW